MKLSIHLEVVKGPARGKQFHQRLEQGQTLIAGRQQPAEIWLPKANVSRVHCRLINRGGRLILEDQASNPTLVNGELPPGPLPLHSGDVLLIGPFHLRVTIEDARSPLFAAERTEDALADRLFGIDPQLLPEERDSVAETNRGLPALIEGTVARCRLTHRLGEGASSEVFRAVREEDGRTVAIKMLRRHPGPSAEQIERFHREARLVGRLSHPHILQLLGGGTHDGRSYIICEYLAGRTLAAVLRVCPILPQPAALQVAYQMADALAYAHSQDMIHRDINPRNIVVQSDEGRLHATLIDFGLAKETGDIGLTSPEQTLGTLGYMAPEQIQRASSATYLADIYGLGATLYRMLAGRPPRIARNLGELILQTEQTEITPLEQLAPDCRPAVAALVARCLARDPARRPQSYRLLLSELCGDAV